MKLTDLNPGWLGRGGEGISRRDEGGNLVPVPRRERVGVTFDCPCGTHGGEAELNRVAILFENPEDGHGPVGDEARMGPFWRRTGDTFDDLTLYPSVQRVGACGWHGWVINGEVQTC